MIALRRLNGKEFVLNCELIKTIESTPDTVITLTNGEKMMVLDKLSDVVAAATAYRRRLREAESVATSASFGEPRNQETRC